MNAVESKEKLISDFKVVMEDAEDLLRATVEQSGETLTATRSKLQSKLAEAKVKMKEIEETVVDKTREAAKATDNYVRENPWRSVGIAAGAGLIVGLLIGRR